MSSCELLHQQAALLSYVRLQAEVRWLCLWSGTDASGEGMPASCWDRQRAGHTAGSRCLAVSAPDQCAKLPQCVQTPSASVTAIQAASPHPGHAAMLHGEASATPGCQRLAQAWTHYTTGRHMKQRTWKPATASAISARVRALKALTRMSPTGLPSRLTVRVTIGDT